MQKSPIEWTGRTWNFARGCTRVSPGCIHCYAESIAHRFHGVRGHPYERGFEPRIVPGKLIEPAQLRSPSVIFVNSMSDVFHPAFRDDFLVAAFKIMAWANWHQYQVLTKRAERMRDFLTANRALVEGLDHVWIGASVEDRRYGVPRIDILRHAPCVHRWLSIEPLLEDLGELDLTGIEWVVVGGESGPGCRPMSEDWLFNIKDQCDRASVPFFFKQWGGNPKGRYGATLRGHLYRAYPEFTWHPPPCKRDRRVFLEQSRAEIARFVT